MTSAMLPPAPSGGPVDDTAVDDKELLAAKTGGGGFWRDVFRRLTGVSLDAFPMHDPAAAVRGRA